MLHVLFLAGDLKNESCSNESIPTAKNSTSLPMLINSLNIDKAATLLLTPNQSNKNSLKCRLLSTNSMANVNPPAAGAGAPQPGAPAVGGTPIPPPPPLPQPSVPTLATPVSFCTHVFNDPQKDPEGENCANLLNPFLVDTANVTPAVLRNQIATKGATLDPLALALLHDGVAKVYLCPQRLDQLLGQPVHS